MSNKTTAATLEYHEATKHSEQSVRTSRHFLDFEKARASCSLSPWVIPTAPRWG